MPLDVQRELALDLSRIPGAFVSGCGHHRDVWLLDPYRLLTADSVNPMLGAVAAETAGFVIISRPCPFLFER